MNNDDLAFEFADEQAASGKRYLWSLNFYQQFFDINTSDVFERMLSVIIPTRSFMDIVNDNPDLYGPIWILATLIVVLFVTSTVASYLSFNGTAYVYNFSLLSLSALLLSIYTFLVPAATWLLLKWYNSSLASLIDCIALYGYSNLIWIPVSVIATIPVAAEFIRWLAILIGFLLSGIFLIRNLSPVILELERGKFILAGLAVIHLVLAVVIKTVFFNGNQL